MFEFPLTRQVCRHNLTLNSALDRRRLPQKESLTSTSGDWLVLRAHAGAAGGDYRAVADGGGSIGDTSAEVKFVIQRNARTRQHTITL